MSNTSPIFSIIIPVRVETDYLLQTLEKIKLQTFSGYEILVISDKISTQPHPSYKRNLGAKQSHGQFLAFLDDDSYPDQNWLINSLKIFQSNPDIAAVCGPCLTPPEDNLLQQASGLVWSSYLGSGGAGVYRNTIQSQRFVDDFPSVNLIVKKESFDKIGGFNQQYWPGEDTLLCSDLVYKLHKKILYHPSVKVFHHRRQVIIPHLQQITRYAIHRGYFAKKFPKTSFRLGYLLPSIFFIYFLLLLPFNLIHFPLINFPIFLYLFLLILTLIKFLLNNNFLASLLAVLSIPPTHLWYGYLFLVGFLKRDLISSPHQLKPKSNQYLGG